MRVAVPQIPPPPAGFGAGLWRLLQAQIAHCDIRCVDFDPCGSLIDLRDEAVEFGSRFVCSTDRRFVLRVVSEDVEDFKHGGPTITQRWFSSKDRARIAYGIAKLRALHGWHHLELPARRTS